jgi:hypothetical protein
MPTMEATAAPDDPTGPYRRWATVLFVVLAIVGLLGVGVELAAQTGDPYRPLLIASSAVTIVLLLAIAADLGHAGAWAVHVIKPLCLLLIATGVLRIFVDIGHGTITIPLEAIGALLVLTREPAAGTMPPLGVADRRRMRGVLVVLVVAALVPYAVTSTRSGVPFGPRPEDLSLTATLDCARAGDGVTPIVARVAWAWTNRGPFPPPTDAVRVEWYATTDGAAAPDAGLTMLAQRPSDDGIHAGGSGETDAILEPNRDPDRQSVEYVISMRDGRPRDGSIELDLVPSDPSSRSGSVELSFAYAHGDRWVQESGLSACSW